MPEGPVLHRLAPQAAQTAAATARAPRRSAQRQRRSDNGSGQRGALELELSAEGFDAVGQTSEPGAACHVRTTAAVVTDLDDECPVCGCELDSHLRCVRVLGRVGEAFGDDEVDGRFDRFGEPLGRDPGELDVERARFASDCRAGSSPRSVRMAG